MISTVTVKDMLPLMELILSEGIKWVGIPLLILILIFVFAKVILIRKNNLHNKKHKSHEKKRPYYEKIEEE